MGDPASIRFWEDNKDEHPLGLYLHWGGGAYAGALATALSTTRGRWDDPEYANRMAVQSILAEFAIIDVDLGAGLYVGTTDHGGPVLNVNWGSKVVWTDDQRIPFENYINGEWKAMQS